jgi:hypothetical protein
MADIKISEMPERASLSGNERFPLIDTTLPAAQQNQTASVQQILPAGGTTGQIPAKQSDNSYDIEWVDAPSSGGALRVLDIDFTQTTAIGGVSTPSVLYTYELPANTLPARGELIIESYVSYVQPEGGLADDFPNIELTHRLGGVTYISRLAVPREKGPGGYRIGGYAKFETRMQAMDSTASQYNDGMLNELTENFSDGAHRSVVSTIYGDYPPMESNTSTINMTQAQTIELVALRDGSGASDSMLVHHYTRVSMITP